MVQVSREVKGNNPTKEHRPVNRTHRESIETMTAHTVMEKSKVTAVECRTQLSAEHNLQKPVVCTVECSEEIENKRFTREMELSNPVRRSN